LGAVPGLLAASLSAPDLLEPDFLVLLLTTIGHDVPKQRLPGPPCVRAPFVRYQASQSATARFENFAAPPACSAPHQRRIIPASSGDQMREWRQ
jgi:hypothetical protein